MNPGLVGVFVTLLLSIGYCLQPVIAGPMEDAGDGRTRVRIKPYVKTSPMRPRTIVFFITAAILGLVFIGMQQPSPALVLAALVGHLAVAVTGNPAGVGAFVNRLEPASQVLAISYIVGLALVTRATLGRRIAILAHVVLYVAMTGIVDTLLIALALRTGWPVGPFAIEATAVNLLVGGLVVLRVTFSTFVLPRPTLIAKDRPKWWWDTILTWCALAMVAMLVVLLYAFLVGRAASDPTLNRLIPMYASSMLFVLLFAPLTLLRTFNRALPIPGGDRPPIDVIVPAYNEEDNLERLIRSIDVAAGRYGGPVRLVISNDGSTDRTETIAHEEVARLRFARGEVLTSPNGGQATALNRGLAMTDAAICVRIDADCLMGEDALVYAAPWFRDPRIGTVGAVEMPRKDSVTWFHRLRALETLFQFRFARAAASVVDGIVVVPGTFTAFRREPVMNFGGFVVGMNGEDADLTMQIGRLGYRAAIDPRITSYEDVPHGVQEFIEQRTRWSRAGVHVFARHNPFRNGSAGPRVWFWSVRRGFSWFSVQMGLMAPVYIAELALTHPTSRRTIGVIAVLYVLAGALAVVVSLPIAIRHKQWRSILWSPTWFAFAFLRRLATLEAMITLPTRPLSVAMPVWPTVTLPRLGWLPDMREAE